MDLRDFAVNSTTTSRPEEKAILEKLNQRLFIGKKLLREKTFPQGQFNIWMGSVKHELRKIYGNEALAQIPPLKLKVPPEILIQLQIEAIDKLETFINHSQALFQDSFGEKIGGKIFIGHGRSPLWRELKDFISERLGLPWNEFNSEAVAGQPTFERISQMLHQAEFAFLIMTAEDEHADSTLHARENVVHEVGLFQGKLGPRRAIILLEEGCKEFSNIIGLSQLRFPKGHISAAFEEIRRVLEREKVI